MELASRVEQRVSTWFMHVERRIYMKDVWGERERGGPRLGWTVGVNVVMGTRGMTVEPAPQYTKDRMEWRVLVYISMIEFNDAGF